MDCRKIERGKSNRCFYCGLDLRRPGVSAGVDHLVPLLRGGEDNACNRVPACGSCRQVKGSLTLDEFRERVRKLLPEWQAMLALSAVLARDERLASPSAFRLLWACAAKAGNFRFPGEALDIEVEPTGSGCELSLVTGTRLSVPWFYDKERVPMVPGGTGSLGGIEDEPVRGRNASA